MGDFKLFFYGMLATGIVWLSAIIIILGFLSLVFGGGLSSWIFIIVGLAIGIFAKAMRFKFRRQSGHIIYSGGSW